MKAKDYYRRLKDTGGDQEKVEETLVAILTELSDEANEILSRKNCKTTKEKMNAINGVVLKWERIIELKEEDNSPESAGLKLFKLNKLGFIASFVELHPEHGDLFDLESFKKELMAQEKTRQEAGRNMPVQLTPLDKITKETMAMELMMSYHNMKSAHDMFCVAGGMSHAELAEHVQPLVRRINILNKWIAEGDVNYDDIETFENEDIDINSLRMNDICRFIWNRLVLEPAERSTFREVPHHYAKGCPEPIIDGPECDTLFLISLRNDVNMQFRHLLDENDGFIHVEYTENENGTPMLEVKTRFKDSIEECVRTINLLPQANENTK